MKIIGWLGQKRRAQRARQLQSALAQEAFERTYPNRVLVWILEAQQNIVCVCYAVTRPPQRSWWLVDEISGTVREMTCEEAEKIIQIPPWR
jgi:hypothetical protein